MRIIQKPNLAKSILFGFAIFLILANLVFAGKAMAAGSCGYVVCNRDDVLNGTYWFNGDKSIIYAQMPTGSNSYAAFTLQSGKAANRVYENHSNDSCHRSDAPDDWPNITINSKNWDLSPKKGHVTVLGTSSSGVCGHWGGDKDINNDPPAGVPENPVTAGGSTTAAGSATCDPNAAQGAAGNCGSGESILDSNPGCSGNSSTDTCLRSLTFFGTDIQNIINFLAGLVGIVVVGMIILGGIQYATAGDNPQALTAAKGRITNALIALFAFIFLYSLMQWLIPGGIF